MMTVSSVVQAHQWWDEWQLRFLVLLSLSIQCMLVLCCPLDRKFHLPFWLKLCIRIAYIASDAVPINALATILNRQKKAPHSTPVHGNRDLELLWAPILLMHIGGSSVVPVQNMEESEQWTKHLTVAVSQVSIALYVFYSSWPSSSADKRQLAAAILIFIPGILKCFIKPWSVKSASFSSLQQARPPDVQNRDTRRIELTEEYVREACCVVIQAATDQDHSPSLDNRHILHYFDSKGLQLQPLLRALCIDHTYPHNDRLAILKSFLLIKTVKGVHSAVGSGLSQIYSLFYTKHDKASRYMQTLNIALPLAAIILFHVSLGEAYSSPQDVKVMYALLYGTLALEIFSLSYLIISTQSIRQAVPLQQNLIGLFSHHKRHAILLRVLRFFGWEQYWNIMKPCSWTSKHINMLVYAYLRNGWSQCIYNAVTYRKFNDNCGEFTLAREGFMGLHERWILGRPFDERILLWHLATDLCYHLQMQRTPPGHRLGWVSQEISNYMVHLLFTNPEMLLVASRRELFMIAYQELEVMFQDGYKYWKEAELRRVIADKVDSTEESEHGFLWEACALTKALMNIEDEVKLWTIIQGVWVEMLCFSASRCRGYLHAKNIGAEYLPQAWLLLAYAGMETLPERHQRTNLKGSQLNSQ